MKEYFWPDTLEKRSSKQDMCRPCLVLMYHRVAQLCHDPLQWAIEPCRFESQMEYLAANCHVISMDELRQHIETAAPFEPRTVVVTFDGGYADLLYAAREILETYQIPATVFSASANIIERGQFWWDTLEDYIAANCFQGQLDIELDGQILEWPLTTEVDRYRAYHDLHSILVDKTPTGQQDILNQIILSVDLQAEELDNHRTMDAQELKELDKSDLIEIGGHTHHGVKLSSLDLRQQAQEVSKNKAVLEEILGHEIKYFSYPFGGNDTRCLMGTAGTVEVNGFSLACGNCYGAVNLTEKMDRYDLLRVKVGNWNRIAFHGFLESFFLS